MIDTIESRSIGLVGVLIDNTVIYNILENESEFLHSGLSIINYLKHNKNKFVSDIINSQSYNSIKYIFDSRMVFNELHDINNSNIEDYYILANQIKHDFENIYIYDYKNDLLIIYYNEGFLALDYKNEQDLRKFIKSL